MEDAILERSSSLFALGSSDDSPQSIADFARPMAIPLVANSVTNKNSHHSSKRKIKSNNLEPIKLRKNFAETWIWSNISAGYFYLFIFPSIFAIYFSLSLFLLLFVCLFVLCSISIEYIERMKD